MGFAGRFRRAAMVAVLAAGIALLAGCPTEPAAARVLTAYENGRIAFVSDGSGNMELWTMWPDGSHAAQLTHTPAAEMQPAWSPDGRHIAFTRSTDDGYYDIFVVDRDGSNETRLTSDPGGTASRRGHRTGRRLHSSRTARETLTCSRWRPMGSW